MQILIADDHAVVRRGLIEILAEAFPGARFTEAGNGNDVLHQLATSEYCMLLLDINMPGRSGLDVLRDVRQAYPKLPAIMVSVQPEEQYAIRCLRAGAAAYISKASAPEELVRATRKVLAGGRYSSATLEEQLLARSEGSAIKHWHEFLSDREHEVMKMIVGGVSLTEIASRLDLSVKTISSYRARIMEKMHMRSNAELVRYAISYRLVE